MSGRAARIDNAGSFAIADNQDVFGGGLVHNLGGATLQKSGGDANSYLDPTFDQDGTLSADSGGFVIRGNGANSHSGAFEFEGGTTLHWNGGTHTVNNATTGIRRSTGTGDFHAVFSGSHVTLNTPFSAQRTTVTNGRATFNDPATTIGPLRLTGGMAELNVDVSTPSVRQSGGVLHGTKTVTTPDYVWTAGTQDTPDEGTPSLPAPGTGRTVIPDGGQMVIDHPTATGETDPNTHNPGKFLQRTLSIAAGARLTLRGRNHQAGNPAATDQQGYLYMSGRAARIDNAGSFAIADNQDVFGGGLVHNLGGATLRRSGGTSTSWIQPTFDNDGTLAADTGTTRLESAANYGSNTLSRGRWELESRLQIAHADIHVNAADVVLRGDAAQIDNQHSPAGDDGLNNFRTNAAAGKLTIAGGKTLVTPRSPNPGPFTSHGMVTVGAASTLTATGGFRNASGATLSGNGTVGPSVSNDGTVGPGASPGTLTVAGDYAQGGGGTLHAEVERTQDGSAHDRLAVTGSATLGGTLAISTPASARPDLGERFDIVTCGGSCSGPFATVTGSDIDGERKYLEVREPQDEPTKKRVTLVVARQGFPDVGISTPERTVQEGSDGTTEARFTVALTAPTLRTVSIDYATADGTAKAGEDYTARSGSSQNETALVFNPGETEKTVTVPVLGDALDEDDEETARLSISNAENANLDETRDEGTLRIADDDLPPRMSIGDVVLEEGDVGEVTARVPVSLSAPSGRRVAVDYATEDDTAKGAQDYARRSGSAQGGDALAFAPGQTQKTIDVPVLGDDRDEPTEAFRVALSSALNATLEKSAGVVTIVDNDPQPRISVTDVRVDEGNSGAREAVFTVSLTNTSDSPISVRYATADETAKAGEDYESRSGALTFDPGERRKEVAVPLIGDQTDERNETFRLELSEASNAQVASGTARATIVDDDGSRLSIDDVRVNEGDTGTVNARFRLALSGASDDPVEVDFATADGTATAPADYEARSGTVRFDPGEITKVVDVPVKGDTDRETDETFDVRLARVSGATLAEERARGTITDDDARAAQPRQEPLPPPVVGQTFNLELVRGTVRVRRPGQKRFERLRDPRQLRMNATIDTRRGRARLTSAANLSSATQTADFFDGVFQVRQRVTAEPVTDLVLRGSLRGLARFRGVRASAAGDPEAQASA
ncbi:MAG: hypothetical protein M3N16_06390, partial [Actinomycetota bacterium]|nr:hypothetical protein [Actinomycetota bacterium]